MPAGSGVLAAAELGAPAVTKRSDLPVRVASAAVMVVVAGGALLLGGWVFDGFVAVAMLGIFVEWTRLVLAFEPRAVPRALWLLSGVVYIGLAGYTALVQLAPVISFVPQPAMFWALPRVIVSVIAVDIGAYFSGRTFRGPKIAPAISPSKTWSGLVGAIAAASAVYFAWPWLYGAHIGVDRIWKGALLYGACTAIVAQSGDFFESWMKRRAGVKDSGRLIPGHGGLFDRADGLIAVLFAIGLIGILTFMMA